MTYFEKLYRLLFELNRRGRCKFCGDIEIKSVKEAASLGLDCGRTSAPCSHLVVSSAELDKLFEVYFP